MTDPKGRDAANPWAMPYGGWLAVLKRSWQQMSEDNLSLIAAGVAFYSFLAMVPLLGAVVLSYGLIADPATVVRHFRQLSTILPGDAARLIGEQLLNVVHSSESKKGFGLLVALAIAFWGATKATGATVTALNVAYEETDERGFLRSTLLNLAMVLGAVIAVGLAMIAITIFSHLQDLLPGTSGIVLALGRLVSWIVLAAIGAGGAATLYRFAPQREAARWTWLTPGSVFAALGWGLLTAGFGIYVANFGHYNATYGSLSAVIVLLTWLYFSAMVLLLGAELNFELEHQTARDTTQGREQPLGARGAAMADRVAPDEARRDTPQEAERPARKGLLPYGLSVSEAALIVLLLMLGRHPEPNPRPAE